MKIIQKLIAILLLAVCLGALALPAAAYSYTEHEGLEVTVQMDKETYNPGEKMTATITVVNTNSQAVTIMNLEQLIPEGYVLSENSEVSMQNVQLQPGQTLVLEVTFEGDPGAVGTGGDFWDKLLYGETWGIPNLLLAVLGGIAVAVFMLLT